MPINDLNRLREEIARIYKSLHNPDFSFVKKVTSLRPYDPLVSEMKRSFEVQEITDENYDVCFRYLLSNIEKQWVVELSMLGRYAVVLRLSGDHSIKIVGENNAEKFERDILSLLTRNDFDILIDEDLEQKIPLILSSTDADRTYIYQALFSDTDILPWKT